MEEKEISIESKLKELRKKQNLSQEDLADALGISRQSVIALEQGRSLPSLPLAVQMCRFFNAAFEEMFEFEREIEKQMESAFENPHKGLNIKIINSEQSGKESKMELEPWRPFREAISLRDAMDRLFEDSFITPAKISGAIPKVDVKDKKDSIVVKAELPGMKEEEVNIEILDNVMTISGEKKEEKEENDEGKGYYYKESHTGAFSRSFALPGEVVAEKADAKMQDGVLTIAIPKVEPKKAHKIKFAKK